MPLKGLKQFLLSCPPSFLLRSSESGCLIQVFGYEGRDVTFSCHYDQGYEDSEKYFCKNDCGSSDVLITTKQKNKGKYSITDDKKIRLVTVTISGLQSHDAGKYWCGVTGWFIDTYSEVKGRATGQKGGDRQVSNWANRSSSYSKPEGVTAEGFTNMAAAGDQGDDDSSTSRD
uniref:Immunoglobulin V-set domain-containing protein n=1 Tax=Xiphophorus couchianus TaxID=32473 RepID=A0A3B5KK67_9TELE